METNTTKTVSFTINGELHTFLFGKGEGCISPAKTLAQVLRDMLFLTGTKTPCNEGACGGCTVLVDNVPTLSCSVLAAECQGVNVLTIEGLRDPVTKKLHPIQQAFIDLDAIQCGMCTPGITLSAKALLDRNPNPTRKEVSEALAGNICRCTGYEKYIDGILLAAKRMRGEEV